MPADLAAPAPTSADAHAAETEAKDFREHQRTYHNVVRAIWIFLAHAALILALMAYLLT